MLYQINFVSYIVVACDSWVNYPVLSRGSLASQGLHLGPEKMYWRWMVHWYLPCVGPRVEWAQP
jgi:hypothetical protein